MNSEDVNFLSKIIHISSIMANQIRYLLQENETQKANELLNVISNFKLLLAISLNELDYESLILFQSLVKDLPYSELNELKQVIDSALATIEVHKGSFH